MNEHRHMNYKGYFLLSSSSPNVSFLNTITMHMVLALNCFGRRAFSLQFPGNKVGRHKTNRCVAHRRVCAWTRTHREMLDWRLLATACGQCSFSPDILIEGCRSTCGWLAQEQVELLTQPSSFLFSQEEHLASPLWVTLVASCPCILRECFLGPFVGNIFRKRPL